MRLGAGDPAAHHFCQVRGCTQVVRRSWLMCPPHWRLVPLPLKRSLLAAYQPGQERLEGAVFPSGEYLLAASAAVRAVARVQHRAHTEPAHTRRTDQWQT